MTLNFTVKKNLAWSTVHPYTEPDVLAYAPTSGGIYLLCTKRQDGDWVPFYVGKSDNLEKRLKDHLNPDEPNACIKRKVANSGYIYARVDSQTDRDGIEKYLYDIYDPDCNEKDPGGKPIPVNLPIVL